VTRGVRGSEVQWRDASIGVALEEPVVASSWVGGIAPRALRSGGGSLRQPRPTLEPQRRPQAIFPVLDAAKPAAFVGPPSGNLCASVRVAETLHLTRASKLMIRKPSDDSSARNAPGSLSVSSAVRRSAFASNVNVYSATLRRRAGAGFALRSLRGSFGAQAVPKPYINRVAYESVASEARNQLEFGTDMQAMVAASDQLRELDPEHPLIAALEARIRRASKINFMALRAKLAARTGVRE
jgi:hypothetical protein